MDMIEEGRRVYKGFVNHAASPDAAQITANSQTQHLFDIVRIFDFTFPRANHLPSSRRDQPAQYCAIDAAIQIKLY